jgi:hypothetical protein
MEAIYSPFQLNFTGLHGVIFQKVELFCGRLRDTDASEEHTASIFMEFVGIHPPKLILAHNTKQHHNPE